MKRSEINKALHRMEDMIREYRISLPDFCHFTPEEWKQKGHEYDEHDHYKPEHRAAVLDEAAQRVFPEALCTVNLIDAEIPVLCRYEILALYERGILLCRHHVEASSFAGRMRGSITP